MRPIVKLLRSEVPAGVSGTLNFTLCVSTIFHSGIAAASLGRCPNFTVILRKVNVYGIISLTNLNLTKEYNHMEKNKQYNKVYESFSKNSSLECTYTFLFLSVRYSYNLYCLLEEKIAFSFLYCLFLYLFYFTLVSAEFYWCSVIKVYYLFFHIPYRKLQFSLYSNARKVIGIYRTGQAHYFWVVFFQFCSI